MDSLSTAYAFTIHDDVADIDKIDRSTVPVPMPWAALLRIETLLDGLDAVKAFYEPAGHCAGHQCDVHSPLISGTK